jgi:hypothetical protein
VFLATLEFGLADDGVSWLADFSLQPLSLDQGSNVPGDPVGPPLEYQGVPLIDDGFKLEMGLVMISGAANPITGSDIEMVAALLGQFVDSQSWCGVLEGELTSPLEYNLTGSTFAAIEVDPDALPSVYPSRCEQLPWNP